ncbi:MAG: ABC-type cobalt transport system, permease component CbiQ [Planctomycetaceae bacterium]|nr:ABC-type cobalt transport system, permease component CbiQ [Planctomycetaceae bacterium]
MSLDFLDRYSRGRTICHRLPTWFKLVLTMAIIAGGLLVPAESWPIHGLLLCLVFSAHSLAGIPLDYLWQRLFGFWVFALALTISIPAGKGFIAGWDLALTILFQSTLAFLAGLWLVNVTPFDRLLQTLHRWGMPRLLVAILAFMYRYSYVVFDELQRMRTARLARGFGRGGWWHNWKSSGQLVGMLLVRSLSRAERVHGAMLARGWTGDVHVLDDPTAEK